MVRPALSSDVEKNFVELIILTSSWSRFPNQPLIEVFKTSRDIGRKRGMEKITVHFAVSLWSNLDD